MNSDRRRGAAPDMTRPLRLFMTADAVGGVWQYALDLARGFGDRAVVTLAVLGPAVNAAQAEEARAIPGLTLVQTGLPLDWTAASASDLERAAAGVAAHAARARPDVIQLNAPALASASFAAPVVAVCHSCVATWWEAVRGGPLPPDFAWRTAAVARGLHAADALVAPTAAFAASVQRSYGLGALPAVVHNGRRPPAAAPAPTEDFVFTAGRLWDEGKNLQVLDRAAARLAVPVLAAGALQGPNGAAVALEAIRSLGPLADAEVAARLARRPVFASLAHYEPFGLAVLEAAQAGCALVLSDIPTFRELWDGAACFVPPVDDEAAAEAIGAIVADRTARERLGAAAREWASRYTVEAAAAGMLAIYGSVLRRPKVQRIKGVAA
jgi:glycosyltransferase involved in cell wall biosynthesis